MTDYRINLAKTMASTPEARRKFYNGMLVYLVCCALGLVYVAYLSSLNIIEGIAASRQRTVLIKTVNAVSEFNKEFYKNPNEAFQMLNSYTSDLGILQTALSERSHFLPVIGQLFADFPDDVAMQGLTASAATKKLSFGLALPLSNQEQGDPVRKLQGMWTGNEELMNRVNSIRPVTGERRVVDGKPVFFVQFECVLK